LLEGDLRLTYYERDEPYIAPLLEEVRSAYEPIASALRYWPLPGRLEVEFAAGTLLLAGPYVDWGSASENVRLLLPSPWLLGIPTRGEWTETQKGAIRYWTAYAALEARARPQPGRLDVTLLQRALLSEYGAWILHQDSARVPILGRLIKQHGEDQLPRIVLSIRGTRLVTLFLARWLRVHPGDEEMFATMLNLEREAIVHGHRETFLALQDPDWLPLQEQYYHRARLGDAVDGTPVVIRELEIAGSRARVSLAKPLSPVLGHPQTTSDGYAEFRLVDWDWRHTRPSDSEAGGRSASAGPTPEPD
jgi:hypothetical protein